MTQPVHLYVAGMPSTTPRTSIHSSIQKMSNLARIVATFFSILKENKTMATFINLTPHAIVIYDDNRNIIRTIPPSGTLARIVTKVQETLPIDGIPMAETSTGDVSGVAEYEQDVYQIVSMPVAQVLSERRDILAPDTGLGAVRDESGRILGTTRLTRYVSLDF